MIAALLTRPMIPVWALYVAAIVLLAVTISKRLKEAREAQEQIARMKRQQLGL